MGTTLNSVTAKLNLTWSFQNDIDGGVKPSYSPTINFYDTLADGTGLDQADSVWYDERTVDAGTPDDIDLSGGITDAFGNSLTLTKLKGLYIKNNSTTAGQILQIGGDTLAAPLFGAAPDYIVLGPGGVFWWWDPSAAAVALGAGATDVLQIAVAAGTSVSYTIAVIGVD